MPLSPSPETVHTLHHTIASIEIQRWEEDDQRVLVITPDNEQPIEAVCVEELDELIAALQAQRDWLARPQPDEPDERNTVERESHGTVGSL